MHLEKNKLKKIKISKHKDKRLNCPLSLRSLSRYSLFSSCRPIPISPSRRPAAFSSRRISLPLPLPLVGQQQGTWRVGARAGGMGRRLASTRHGGQAAGGGERATPHPQTTGPAITATSAPSPATSITRYALPLVFSSCCAKPCAQALTYYLYSDLEGTTPWCYCTAGCTTRRVRRRLHRGGRGRGARRRAGACRQLPVHCAGRRLR
jgi:hypothetical protein